MALAFFEKAQELDKEKEIPELLLKNIKEAEDKAKDCTYYIVVFVSVALFVVSCLFAKLSYIVKKEEESFQKTRHKKLGHQENPPNYTLLASAAIALGAIVLFSYFAKNR